MWSDKHNSSVCTAEYDARQRKHEKSKNSILHTQLGDRINNFIIQDLLQLLGYWFEFKNYHHHHHQFLI